MKEYLRLLLLLLTIVYTGCATSQLLDITSEPSKVAVSVDEEFIGKTPVSYEIEDVDDFDSLRIVAEKSGFESDMKRIKRKRSNGLFPSMVHFVLEPTYSAGERKSANSSPQIIGGQQMQGPTIVIPSSGPEAILQTSPEKNTRQIETPEKNDIISQNNSR